MNNLACAIAILEKNKYIMKKHKKRGLYGYWRISFKIEGIKFKKNLLEKLKNQKHVFILDSFLVEEKNQGWIEFTTNTAIFNGLKRIFEKENVTKWKGYMYENENEIKNFIKNTEEYSIHTAGINNSGILVEIIDIKKQEEVDKKRKKIEKEANDLLNKIL